MCTYVCACGFYYLSILFLFLLQATLRTANIRAIIHNSAYVNHALQFRALRPHNVGSTETAIKLAAELTTASGVACHCAFVSTGGVCGRLSFADAEEPARLDASVLATQNGYVQGKWVSERLIENAAAAFQQLLLSSSSSSAALPASPVYSIFRPGAVTAHSVTGASNISDSVNRYLIGWSLLGAAPPLDPAAQVDTSPVDWYVLLFPPFLGRHLPRRLVVIISLINSEFVLAKVH